MHSVSRLVCRLAFVPLLLHAAQGQATSIASLSSAGVQGDDSSGLMVITPDGRWIVFESEASNLVAGDTNGVIDIFRRDRQTGTTVRVSVSTALVEGNGTCGWSDVSANGRWIVFDSAASNLVAGDTNGMADIFLRDMLGGTTVRVSVATGGAQGNGMSSRPAISADGRWISFASFSSNLVVGDTNGAVDIFVHDTQSGTTVRVNVSSAGAQASLGALQSDISDDGRYVAFASYAANLVPGDTNATGDVFVRDLLAGVTSRVSVDSLGTQANGASEDPCLSGDGRCVAFASVATNLAPGDTNGAQDAFVHDTWTGLVVRASTSTGGAQANGSCHVPQLSTNGRWLAFMSSASNLVALDANNAADVFLRDMDSGTTELVSVTAAGTSGNLYSTFVRPTASGRFVAFSSRASDLVSGDANGFEDVFVRDRGAATPPQGFCAGDGSAGLCPCANTSAPGSREGCRSSLGTGGKLHATGEAVLGGDTLVLHGTLMPNSSALYFQGTASINGGLGTAFGDGLRCAGGTIVRLATKSNVAGASRYPETGDPSVSARGMVTAGTRTYQVWYRNAAAFCTPSTFNLTNGLLVTWAGCPICP